MGAFAVGPSRVHGAQGARGDEHGGDGDEVGESHRGAKLVGGIGRALGEGLLLGEPRGARGDAEEEGDASEETVVGHERGAGLLGDAEGGGDEVGRGADQRLAGHERGGEDAEPAVRAVHRGDAVPRVVGEDHGEADHEEHGGTAVERGVQVLGVAVGHPATLLHVRVHHERLGHEHHERHAHEKRVVVEGHHAPGLAVEPGDGQRIDPPEKEEEEHKVSSPRGGGVRAARVRVRRHRDCDARGAVPGAAHLWSTGTREHCRRAV